MLGRGALAMPNLANVVRGVDEPMEWEQVVGLLLEYSGYEIFGDKGRYFPNRIKQWLGYLKILYPQAEKLFMSIRAFRNSDEIVNVLNALDLRGAA